MGSPVESTRFSYEASLKYLHQLTMSQDLRLETNIPKQMITAWSPGGEKQFDFRLPLPCPPLPETPGKLAIYTANLPEAPPPYVMALVQAGAAALGYFEEGEVVAHKAIKKYMKRQKQGKAQINYLNTRGKSKAGSRIRLANTITFFEEINERLSDWEKKHPPQRILYSCTARLWGMIFQSKVTPPFTKKDPRLVRIPRDVHIPCHEELLRIDELCRSGWLYPAEQPEK